MAWLMLECFRCCQSSIHFQMMCKSSFPHCTDGDCHAKPVSGTLVFAQLTNSGNDRDGSSIFLILLEIKLSVLRSAWVAEQLCCGEHGRSGFVQSQVWLSKEWVTLPEQRWMWLYAGQLSSERKVVCLPVAWSHAEQPSGSAFTCKLPILCCFYLGWLQVESFCIVIPGMVPL